MGKNENTDLGSALDKLEAKLLEVESGAKTWGEWRVDDRHFILGDDRYYVALEDVNTPQRLYIVLQQLWEKTWGTSTVLGDFVRAVFDTGGLRR